MTKVNRAALASAIYASNVDLDQPMLWKMAAAESFRAADVWIEFYRGNEEAQELSLEINEQVIQILKLVKGGQKIQAIKDLRTRTGLGLKEAKDRVDFLEKKFKDIDFEGLTTDEAIQAMLKTGPASAQLIKEELCAGIKI